MGDTKLTLEKPSRHTAVNLCLETDALNKGDVMLPVYRSARGSRSLQSIYIWLGLFLASSL